MGLSHAKGTGFHSHPTPTHTSMHVCVHVCVSHYILGVGFRGGWQRRCVCEPACLPACGRMPIATLQIGGRSALQNATSPSLMVVSNIYVGTWHRAKWANGSRTGQFD